MCHDVIGYLLSRDTVERSRPTGHYTADELHLMFPDCDGVRIVRLLKSIELCTEITDSNDSELEYELPCYNLIEMDDCFVDGEDDVAVDRNDWKFGGVRVIATRAASSQLAHVFPRVQIRLRRGLSSALSVSDCTLEQWYGGSRCSWTTVLQAVVTVSIDGRSVDVRCRASNEIRSKACEFIAGLVELVVGAIEDCLPGIVLEQHLLSPAHIAAGAPYIHAYTPKDVRGTVNCGVSPPIDTGGFSDEDVCHLVAFGSCEAFSSLVPGTSLSVASGALSHDARRRLSRLLDPPDPTGRDWCLLAVWLGVDSDCLAVIDSERSAISPTDRCIAAWSMQDSESATVLALIKKLTLLGRHDAVNVLLETVPLFVGRSAKLPTKSQIFSAAQSRSCDSDLTVSSAVSR
jgi:death-associated protein kinase